MAKSARRRPQRDRVREAAGASLRRRLRGFGYAIALRYRRDGAPIEDAAALARNLAGISRKIVGAQVLALRTNATKQPTRESRPALQWKSEKDDARGRAAKIALDQYLASPPEATDAETPARETADAFAEAELRSRLIGFGAELARMSGSADAALERVPSVAAMTQRIIAQQIRTCFLYTTMMIGIPERA